MNSRQIRRHTDRKQKQAPTPDELAELHERDKRRILRIMKRDRRKLQAVHDPHSFEAKYRHQWFRDEVADVFDRMEQGCQKPEDHEILLGALNFGLTPENRPRRRNSTR